MNYLKKFFTKKNVLIILAVILTGGSFFLAKNVLAVDDNWDGVATMVVWLTSWLVHILVYVFGQLLLIAISILIKVCSFNEFVEADIVTTGWVIIRDLANLGIVIMMLVIAFGTTLNKNAYKYQTMLPKLLVSAILINFSKEITGLLISLSQYLMMYFVHAFENIAAGNITYGLGIDDMLSVRKAVRSAGGGAEINDWNVLGALIMSMVMLAVALGVVLTMALMLLRRIVAFWMLLIMSPIYFVADLIPPAKEYASQWKKELTDNLVKGPTLAFMFWLSMTVLSKITDQNRIINLQMQSEQAASGGALSTTDYAFFASKMSSPQRVFDYLITIILFLFTMNLAKKAGGMAGKFAGAYSGRLDKVGKWFSSRPGKIKDAAWNRAKTTRGAYALQALKNRATPEWMTKEGKEKEAQKRQANMRQMFGGTKGSGAVREFEHRQSGKLQKEMKERGDLDTKELAYNAFQSMLKKGDKIGAQAVIKEMADKKWLSPKIMDEYQQKFGYRKEGQGLKTRTGEDAAIFEEVAWGSQGKSGDAWADYKVSVERNAVTGAYQTKNRDEIKKKLQDDTSKEDLRDLNSKITARNLTGAVDEKGNPKQDLELDFILGLAGHQHEIGRIDQGKRKIIADATKNILANKDAWNISTEDEKTLNEFYRYVVTKDYDEATGIKNFDKRSGRLEPAGHLEAALVSGGPELEEARLKMGGKTMDYKREVVEAGQEKVSNIDSEMNKKVYKKQGRKNTKKVVNNLYKAKNQLLELDETSSTTDLNTFKTNFISYVEPINNEVAFRNSEATNQINPQTGELYKLGELYEESEFYKTQEFVKKLINSITTGKVKLNQKNKKALDDALSYMTAHLRDISGANRELLGVKIPVIGKLMEEHERETRQETIEYADAVSDELGKLTTETNPRQRGKIINKAHKKAKHMRVNNSPRVLKHLTQPDDNYTGNIRNLEDNIDANRQHKYSGSRMLPIRPRAKSMNTQEIELLQQQAQEIKNYNV